MLAPATRVVAWRLLKSFHIPDQIFRFLKRPSPQPNPETRGSRNVHIFEQVSPGQSIAFSAALAAAVAEYSAEESQNLSDWKDSLVDGRLPVRQVVQAIRQALRLSNEESDGVEETLRGLIVLLASDHRIATLKRLLARPTADASRAILAALPPEVVPQRTSLDATLAELERTDVAPAPLITGDDLTAAGLAPGPIAAPG